MNLLPQTNFTFGPGKIGRSDTSTLIFEHCGTNYYLEVLIFEPGETAPLLEVKAFPSILSCAGKGTPPHFTLWKLSLHSLPCWIK